MLAWLTITPLGSLVEPEVYCRKRRGEWASRTSWGSARPASVLTIHGSRATPSRRSEKDTTRSRAWLSFMDHRYDRSVITAAAPQSRAMKFILVSAARKPWLVGG